MSYPPWSGRRVRRLINATLYWKGTVCHLCGEPGSNSADHDPPRSELIRAGVPNPDALCYLWPSHKVCNLRRGTKPVTDALRASLRRRMTTDPTPAPTTAGSARFARFFEPAHPAGRSGSLHLSPGAQGKTEEVKREGGQS